MTTVTIYATYSFFDAVELSFTGKTRKLRLINTRAGVIIGDVSWYGPWRQYCLFPVGNTVWSKGCLEDVKSLMKKLDAERKV